MAQIVMNFYPRLSSARYDIRPRQLMYSIHCALSNVKRHSPRHSPTNCPNDRRICKTPTSPMLRAARLPTFSCDDRIHKMFDPWNRQKCFIITGMFEQCWNRVSGNGRPFIESRCAEIRGIIRRNMKRRVRRDQENWKSRNSFCVIALGSNYGVVAIEFITNVY